MVLTAPSPSSKKGDVVLQPAYFTSSLFVDALREDITGLITAVSEKWARTPEALSQQPFATFKAIWHSQGWPWMHIHVLDARSRDRFIAVVLRLFLERTSPTEPPFTRVIALFALYTFHQTQPSHTAPELHRRTHIPIALDLYQSLLAFPSTLVSSNLQVIKEQAFHVLSVLVDGSCFQILPPSTFHAENPRDLPREIFVQDGIPLPGLTNADGTTVVIPTSKKKGRPSKRDKTKKAKEALDELEKWLDRTSLAAESSSARSCRIEDDDLMNPAVADASSLISKTPKGSLDTYRTLKQQLLNSLSSENAHADDASANHEALHRANQHILLRLKRLDQLAAERGLEVGGAGGERTGLARVERAVSEWAGTAEVGQRGGILGLMEGAGLPTAIGETASSSVSMLAIGEDHQRVQEGDAQ